MCVCTSTFVGVRGQLEEVCSPLPPFQGLNLDGWAFMADVLPPGPSCQASRNTLPPFFLVTINSIECIVSDIAYAYTKLSSLGVPGEKIEKQDPQCLLRGDFASHGFSYPQPAAV